MINPKEQVTEAIVRARADLDKALSDLELLPAFDPGNVFYVAHTLNNFLAVATGTTELLLMALADYPDPQVRTWLEGLLQITERMEHLVARVMNSVPAGSEPALRWDRVDLQRLLQRAVAYYQKIADRKGIRLALEPGEQTLDVRTDRVAVAAVLDNLLSNAVKYSPHGKQVWVSTRAEPDHVVCTVRDEGPGIATEEQGRLFQRGVRLGHAPTGGEPSTGYGLAVAKDLVTRLGGEIWCESQPGQGARFSFRLPAWREAAEASAPAPPGPPASGPTV